MRKTPRDFVHVDEFWQADEQWKKYYIQQKVWVYCDEYRAELPGDQTYSRIIIHSASDQGWMFHRPLSEKDLVHRTLDKIALPVSEQQLEYLGFTPWNANKI